MEAEESHDLRSVGLESEVPMDFHMHLYIYIVYVYVMCVYTSVCVFV